MADGDLFCGIRFASGALGVAIAVVVVHSALLAGGLPLNDALSAVCNGVSILCGCGIVWALRRRDNRFFAPFLIAQPLALTALTINYVVRWLRGEAKYIGFFAAAAFLFVLFHNLAAAVVHNAVRTMKDQHCREVRRSVALTLGAMALNGRDVVEMENGDEGADSNPSK